MILSYDNKKKNIDQEYAYRPMPIDLSKNSSGSPDNRRTKRYPWQLKIYIPQEHRIIFEKAKAIAKREGRSLSDLIRDLLRDYVRIHEPGNPQLPLTKFTGEEKLQEPPRWLTCTYSRKELVKGEFYCERFGFWRIPQACERCRRYRPEE